MNSKTRYKTKVLDAYNNLYPKSLLDLKEKAPEQIYIKSKNKIEWGYKHTVAIVGTRRITKYGIFATNKIVSELCKYGINIVSGFMYGVDATAHKATLDNGGKTLAVFGNGVDVVHPNYHKDLYEKLLETSGMIISEYPEGTKPQIWTYPQRNRIIAALSRIIIVTEAGLPSGSLITAKWGFKLDRKVFCIPGQINSTQSKGTNELIKNYKAELLTDSKQILEYLGIHSNKKEYEILKLNLNKLETTTLSQIKNNTGLSTDELFKRLNNHNPAQIIQTLTNLEMENLVYIDKGKYYAASS